jgi:hypothetical protein
MGILYQVYFYVPESHVELVKQAIFNAGAGRYDHYDSCCWQTLGQGQFRPLQESQPFLGQTDQLEIVAEYRVETICSEQCLKDVILALKSSHPYQTPAYGVIRLVHDDLEEG